MRQYLLKLYAHEHWANAELIGALKKAPKVPPRTEALLAHLFSAHRFWDIRVHGTPLLEFNFWPPHSLEQCEKFNDEFARKWAEYIGSLPDPLDGHVVKFTAFDGTPRVLRALDILTQLHAHSIHHRAQIMLDMKAAGLEPVPTDYLLYCRKHD